eukprot:NODE_2119_length_763_cov_19.911765_g1706_i0.p1 GENE.NODE_2119_length_763_cov_19.911765_g1706_i0~~NODE_2119_length_763_cov_19.911765_g1706_i0.p1  ORF type:complete len:155 (-),score=31.41 NODE_2119_length_763_cov_19.911765_g1706_i0:253-717(-)
MSAPTVCVADVANKGLGLVAVRDIHAGELIIEEQPTLWMVDSEQRQRVCCWCMACVDDETPPIVCQDCAEVCWCSDACVHGASAEAHKLSCLLLRQALGMKLEPAAVELLHLTAGALSLTHREPREVNVKIGGMHHSGIRLTSTELADVNQVFA